MVKAAQNVQTAKAAAAAGGGRGGRGGTSAGPTTPTATSRKARGEEEEEKVKRRSDVKGKGKGKSEHGDGLSDLDSDELDALQEEISHSRHVSESQGSAILFFVFVLNFCFWSVRLLIYFDFFFDCEPVCVCVSE